MAIYAIGDLQGCLGALLALEKKLNFNADRDQLWLVGDLVNRGPDSLGALRFLHERLDNVVAVLGNHDMHLLAHALASGARRRRKDTLDDILDAPDGRKLIDWVYSLPLMIEDRELRVVMVHAGIPPGWSLKQLRSRVAQLHHAFDRPSGIDLLENLYDPLPARWRKRDGSYNQNRFTLSALTRIRYVTPDWNLDYDTKGGPGSEADDLVPWYEVLDDSFAKRTVVFGHWSTLGVYRQPGLLGLDSGCVWGGELTAARLDDPEAPLVQVSCNF